METTYTFSFLKPDAFYRGLVPQILGHLQVNGLHLVRCEMRRPPRIVVEAHYAEHAGRDYFENLVKFVANQPVLAMVLSADRGTDAVAKLRAVMGPYKDPARGTIRGDLMLPGDTMANLIHGADSPDSAIREAELWFGKGGLSPVES